MEKRLKEVRKSLNLSQQAFGKALGLVQSSYANYETGRSTLPATLLKNLYEKFNVNLYWLISGQGPMFNSAANFSEVKPEFKNGSISVPMTDLRLSAGKGNSWGDSNFTGEILHLPKRIASRYPGNSDFVGATVSGDSMEPTLHDGEPVVFVKDYIQGDGIYALAAGGELLIKRLEFNPILKKLRIISDNKKYPITEIDLSDSEFIKILGKVVIWIHRES